MKIRISQTSKITSFAFLGLFTLLFIFSCQKDEFNESETKLQLETIPRNDLLDPILDNVIVELNIIEERDAFLANFKNSEGDFRWANALVFRSENDEKTIAAIPVSTGIRSTNNGVLYYYEDRNSFCDIKTRLE